ncbi:NAD(P)H-dependent oxidoreductase [Catenulispora yoronensis]|uniref:FMN dependent NADH:quinone oxidoreductase n=1 Tax=Catenulispora yoronensis TaxID=450799 RepID=A0ABP5H3F5_9ACTN
MPHLLHLTAGARRASHSARVADAFAESWLAATPDAVHTRRDLTEQPVPPIREAWTTICDTLLREGITDISRYPEAVRTPAEREAWSIVEPLLAELVAADVVLIGSPMYNFGVSAALKAWIDQVTFPKMDLAPRRFVIAYARGGSYLPGAPREPYEYQVRYLLDFFAGHYAIPAADVHVVGAELTNALVDPGLAARRPQHEDSLARALADAAALGRSLALGRALMEGV